MIGLGFRRRNDRVPIGNVELDHADFGIQHNLPCAPFPHDLNLSGHYAQISVDKDRRSKPLPAVRENVLDYGNRRINIESGVCVVDEIDVSLRSDVRSDFVKPRQHLRDIVRCNLAPKGIAMTGDHLEFARMQEQTAEIAPQRVRHIATRSLPQAIIALIEHKTGLLIMRGNRIGEQSREIMIGK